MKKSYRLTLDYNEYKFKTLKKDYGLDKTITWYIETANPKIKYDFLECKSKNKEIDAYIYCSNLPDKLNRFVFKGRIKSVEENYLQTDEEKRFKDYKTKIIVDNIKAFSDSDDDICKLAVRNGEKDGKKIIFSPQGTYCELDESVVNILKDITADEDLDVFLKRFTGCKCELENIKEFGLSHTLFEKDNEDNYIEFHHLIFRNFGYADKELLKKLDSNSYNYSKLCPSCHRAIHHGNNVLKKKMLDELIKNKGGKLEQFYNECLKNKSFKEKIEKYNQDNFIDFMYSIYGIKNNVNNE